MKPSPRSVASLLLLALATACGEPALTPRFDDHVAEAVHGPTSLAGFRAEDGYRISPVLEAPDGATRVSFMIDLAPERADEALLVEARGFDARGEATGWRPAIFTWSEDVIRVAKVDLPRASFGIEVRLPEAQLGAVVGLSYTAVVPMAEAMAPAVDATVDVGAPTVSQPLLAGVRPRSDWGAAPTRCTSQNTTKTRISIHHTVTPTTSNGSYEARLRGIQQGHFNLGWCDVGYHYLATVDGTVWEARPAQYLGSHVGGQNTNNLGISMVGCFHTSDCASMPPQVPPEVLIESVAEFVATAASHYGITISSSTVMGHRDNPGQSTACPGNHAHARLDDIRQMAANGGTPTPTTGRALGTVWDLGVTTDPGQATALGARLPGATITCSCGQTTTAREGDAVWSFDLPPGTYTFTATLDGYEPASSQAQVTAGGDVWASIGISPVDTAVGLTVAVVDDESDAAIENARVEVTGADPLYTNASGEVAFALTAGDVTVRASAEGYEAAETTRELTAGADETIELRLVKLTVSPPDDDDPGDGNEGPGEDPGEEGEDPGEEPGPVPGEDSDLAPTRISIPPSSPEVASGCRCVTGDADATDPTHRLAGLLLLGALGLLSRRRR